MDQEGFSLCKTQSRIIPTARQYTNFMRILQDNLSGAVGKHTFEKRRIVVRVSILPLPFSLRMRSDFREHTY